MNIKKRFKDFIIESQKENERLIVVIANTTAFIDDELYFSKCVYKKLISENPKLKGEDLTIFLRVEADFSSGSRIYEIKGGKMEEVSDETWDRITSYLKSFVTSLNDLKKSDKIERYEVDMYDVDCDTLDHNRDSNVEDFDYYYDLKGYLALFIEDKHFKSSSYVDDEVKSIIIDRFEEYEEVYFRVIKNGNQTDGCGWISVDDEGELNISWDVFSTF